MSAEAAEAAEAPEATAAAPLIFDEVDTLVLAGGGVRGMAYAGAFQELATVYDFWSARRPLKKVCGCSIGSLFGAMIVVGATADEIAAGAREQPMRALIDPDVKLLVSRFGFDAGDTLLEWVDGLLAAKTGRTSITFRDCFELTGVEFEVSATNLNLARVEYLSHRTAPEMRVAEAVAISMSLPPIFCGRLWNAPVGVATGVTLEMVGLGGGGGEAGAAASIPSSLWEVGQRVRLPPEARIEPIDGAELSSLRGGVIEKIEADGSARVRVERACTLIDGGLLDNYPIRRCDPRRTLGFKLQWKNAFTLGSLTSYFSRVACVALTAAERLDFDTLPERSRANTITIDTGPVSTVDINLSLEDIEALFARGRLAMVEFMEARSRRAAAPST